MGLWYNTWSREQPFCRILILERLADRITRPALLAQSVQIKHPASIIDSRCRHGLGQRRPVKVNARLVRRDQHGKVVTFALRPDSVFEDLIPRLVDVDQDGRDEIIVVRSHEEAGASVVLLGLRGNRLIRLAESVAIGIPNRWVNPIGAADFDGDGQAEIAAVETPHIGGKLLLLEIEGRRLSENDLIFDNNSS